MARSARIRPCLIRSCTPSPETIGIAATQPGGQSVHIHLEQPGRAGPGLRPPRRDSSCRVWLDIVAPQGSTVTPSADMLGGNDAAPVAGPGMKFFPGAPLV
jgi:hypothetical protein